MAQLAEHLTICFKLMKSCMGSGIYTYPTIFAEYGVCYTLILTLLSCAASILGTYIYIDRNKELGKENSISTLGAILVSTKFKRFVDLVVILKCVAVAAGYLNLAKSLLTHVFADVEFLGLLPSTIAFLLTGLGCLVLTPSVLGPNLGRLKYLSYFGTFAILAMITLSFVEARDRTLAFDLWAVDPPNLIKRIGQFVFVFSCHQSILTVHNEATVTERQLKLLIFLSFAGVSCLYLCFGFINYAAFLRTATPIIKGNIFLSWNSKGLVAKLAMGLFASSLICTVPFQLHPAKTYFIDMVGAKGQGYLAAISMLLICFFLTTQTWYNFEFVSNYATKPFNSLLCFGFPLLYTAFGKFRRTYADYLIGFYLALFTVACFASFAM